MRSKLGHIAWSLSHRKISCISSLGAPIINRTGTSQTVVTHTHLAKKAFKFFYRKNTFQFIFLFLSKLAQTYLASRISWEKQKDVNQALDQAITQQLTHSFTALSRFCLIARYVSHQARWHTRVNISIKLFRSHSSRRWDRHLSRLFRCRKCLQSYTQDRVSHLFSVVETKRNENWNSSSLYLFSSCWS